MTTTPNIRPGAVLAVAERSHGISHWPKVTNNLYTVSRLTATQAIAVGAHGEIRVHLKNLRVVGEDYTYAAIASDELQARHAAQVAEVARYSAANKLVDDLIGRHLHQLKLTTEQLETLAKAWVKIKAMAPTAEGQKR